MNSKLDLECFWPSVVSLFLPADCILASCESLGAAMAAQASHDASPSSLRALVE